MSTSGWIGVDLDGCLAKYGKFGGLVIGDPVPAMVERVKRWLREGNEVRIFTARACDGNPQTISEIQDWTEHHIGVRLKVTNVKDFAMTRLYDDRCVQVEFNTGRLIGVSESGVD